MGVIASSSVTQNGVGQVPLAPLVNVNPHGTELAAARNWTVRDPAG